MSDEVRDAAQSFEGSLMILRKDKNGWVFGFSVHPSEAPSPLLDAPLGTRFQCVMFQIADDESLVVPENVAKGRNAVAVAGEMCRNEDFQKYIAQKFYQFRPPEEMKIGNPIDESECAEIIRQALGIDSRSELLDNEEAREALRSIIIGFREHFAGTQVHGGF